MLTCLKMFFPWSYNPLLLISIHPFTQQSLVQKEFLKMISEGFKKCFRKECNLGVLTTISFEFILVLKTKVVFLEVLFQYQYQLGSDSSLM